MKTIFDLRKKKEVDLYQRIERYYGEEWQIVKFSEGDIASCIGCWDCWLKTPGRCVIKDYMFEKYDQYVNSEKVIILFDTAQGFINHLGKAFIDRSIPHYHPYIRVVDGECRHLPRYKRLPDMGFYFERQGLTKQEEECIEDYLYRTAYQFNVKGFLIDETDSFTKSLSYREAKLGKVRFEKESPIKKMIIYHGSPRKKVSNTGLILNEMVEKFGEKIEIRDLRKRDQWKKWSESFQHEEHIMLFLPLYVHAMPSHVMGFIEKLQKSKGTIAFFVQSGFPESSQSHYLEAYFELLSRRLGRKYLGTIIKGGMEGLQARPSEGQKKMIKPLVDILESLMETGEMPENLLEKAREPKQLGLGGKIFMKTGVINYFWDQQLKNNGAYHLKNDKPFEDQK